MKDFQNEFLDFAIECEALRFGSFTLKSGRTSPYFFNSGVFNTGTKLARLGRYYALALADSGITYDMVFGPAYKGIPLVCATAMAITDRAVPYAFNRKEVKSHGDGGHIVGHPLHGNVVILDDVISAGKSVRESVSLIQSAGATPTGVVIALDRQERGEGERSAVQEVETTHKLRVASIIKLDTLLMYLEQDRSLRPNFEAVRSYRQQYGITT